MDKNIKKSVMGTWPVRLPVKTAPVQNGPSPKRPHFRLKRPQAKKKSVKTAPFSLRCHPVNKRWYAFI